MNYYQTPHWALPKVASKRGGPEKMSARYARRILCPCSWMETLLLRFGGMETLLLRFEGIETILLRFAGMRTILLMFGGMETLLLRFAGMKTLLHRFAGMETINSLWVLKDKKTFCIVLKRRKSISWQVFYQDLYLRKAFLSLHLFCDENGVCTLNRSE